MSCRHRSTSEKFWLPLLDGLLHPHPCCRNCGVVKNVSGDRGRGAGYYMNVLSEIKRYLEKNGSKLSDAQVRLISKTLNCEEFGDTYWIRGSVQKSLFVAAVAKYANLSPAFIESFL